MAVLQLGAILFGFWILVSGSVDPANLGVGLVVALLVSWMVERVLWTKEDAPLLSWGQARRLLLYLAFLIKEIIWANIYVAEIVLHPRLPIDPVIVEHTTMFKRPVSETALANSITLTPGTLTVDVDDSVFFVHCLGREFAEDIASRKLDHMIAKVFEEA